MPISADRCLWGLNQASWLYPEGLMWELNEFIKYLDQGLAYNKH